MTDIDRETDTKTEVIKVGHQAGCICGWCGTEFKNLGEESVYLAISDFEINHIQKLVNDNKIATSLTGSTSIVDSVFIEQDGQTGHQMKPKILYEDMTPKIQH